MPQTNNASKAASEFSGRATAYAAGRPHWPESFMQYVATRVGIEPDHVIVDFGSGTGNSAEYFVNKGNLVYGVDRDKDMREKAQIKFAGQTNFVSVAGTAREPNLKPGVKADFILVAQALHWWDHEKEQVGKVWQKILKPEGKLVVLFYNPDERNALAREIHACFTEKWAPYRESRVPLMHAPALKVENASSYIDHGRGLIHERGLAMCTLRLNLQGFTNLMFSYSFAPEPETGEAESLRPELQDVFHRYQKHGAVEIPYLADMVAGTLARGPV